MKLGSETGSLMNHLYSRGENPEPEVGMGATILGWTDRHAGTVIAYDGKVVTIQRDICIRVDKNGMSEDQAYQYKPNPDGRIDHFKRDRKGAWRLCERKANGRWAFIDIRYSLMLGHREEYYDYSF